jgi:LPXTG-motif cell wall-anchored protein
LEKKMKLSSLRSRKGLGAISTMLLVGAIAMSQSGQFMAAADEVSTVTTITSAECSATSEYLLKLSGDFPTPISEVAVNYINIDHSLWTQSATQISVRVPAESAKPYIALLQFGNIEFVMADVVCAGYITPVEETTEDGGLLPDTGSNNYNYLATGLGLAFVGSAGLLRRKPVKA